MKTPRFALVSLLAAACSASPSPEPQVAPAPAPPPLEPAPVIAEGGAPLPPDDARGARLYDNWRSEKKLEKTSGANPDGTLNDGAGKVLPNTGHDYRLKNLFGWDLRGKNGIYGPDYQNKSYVLAHDLLADTRPAEEIRAWLERGSAEVPAFGQVLDARDLDELVAFVDRTRKGELARPEQIFRLEKSAPKGFVLNEGGDAARGAKLYADTCARCHGKDGTKFPIDDTESVGTLSRSSGYEIWFKIAHGHPGSTMKRQVSGATGAEQAAKILDLLAALCDRQAFPALPGAKDVPDGDPRCGVYLR
jgi:cytochrome c553